VGDDLMRDSPDEVLAAIDARAAKLGVSRAEYVRRRLAQDAMATPVVVTAIDLKRFGVDLADLSDPEVTAGAWDRSVG